MYLSELARVCFLVQCSGTKSLFEFVTSKKYPKTLLYLIFRFFIPVSCFSLVSSSASQFLPSVFALLKRSTSLLKSFFIIPPSRISIGGSLIIPFSIKSCISSKVSKFLLTPCGQSFLEAVKPVQSKSVLIDHGVYF